MALSTLRWNPVLFLFMFYVNLQMYNASMLIVYLKDLYSDFHFVSGDKFISIMGIAVELSAASEAGHLFCFSHFIISSFSI